jgi:hypothetical protein
MPSIIDVRIKIKGIAGRIAHKRMMKRYMGANNSGK